MATVKTLKATADYEKDTAKGKRRYRVESDKVVGTIYIDPSVKDAPDSFDIALTPADES